MHLEMVDKGSKVVIQRILGNEKVVRHLNGLGFVVGDTITVINEICGNVIIQVKDSRIALDKNMARKIIVEESTYVNEKANGCGMHRCYRHGNRGKSRRFHGGRNACHGYNLKSEVSNLH